MRKTASVDRVSRCSLASSHRSSATAFPSFPDHAMSLLRASSSLRRAAAAVPRRHLAIASTVRQATDTSKMDFPAPSHVSLPSQAAELASQLTNFYSDPGMYYNRRLAQNVQERPLWESTCVLV